MNIQHKCRTGLVAALATLALGGGGLAQAADSHLLLHAGIGYLVSDAKSDGPLDLDVGDQPALEMDATYFVTPAIGVNLLAAFVTPEVKSAGASLGSIGLVPPMLVGQFHFGSAGSPIRPYLGAGINYNLFHDKTGSLDSLRVKVDDSIGLVGQVGANMNLSRGLTLNADVRYLKFDSDVTVGANQALNDKLKYQGFLINLGLGFWL
ncbi:outer membrane protein [Solimonas aquatica]|uniref:Outer membrane protein n=1 Tax=Solimonas aquatica TaxID=489703 RepID=A0A1H9FWW2_9GAMM|nr:OmpW family outer membrane protein [Solimonas aquatica]SEQ42391.1 outer membrane protein [Solimonas aquatica]